MRKYLYIGKILRILFTEMMVVKGDYIGKINQILGAQGLVYLVITTYGPAQAKIIIRNANEKAHGNVEHFSYELTNHVRNRLMLKYEK